jgi:hypothetical protein
MSLSATWKPFAAIGSLLGSAGAPLSRPTAEDSSLLVEPVEEALQNVEPTPTLWQSRLVRQRVDREESWSVSRDERNRF